MASNIIAVFTGTTPAAPGSAVLGLISPDPANLGGNAVYGALSRYESIAIDCTRAGAAGGVLNLFLQASLDEGASWTDLGHWAQLAAGAAQVRDIVSISRFQSNTTPVVTGDAAMVAVSFVAGEFTNRLRVKAVAGSGTTAGAAYTIRVFGNAAGSRQ